MKIGYARVSTEDQSIDPQIFALRSAGCVRIFADQGISGKKMERPGLDKVLRSIRSGQTLVVWRLDRLGRSLSGLVQFVERIGEQGVEFQSLSEEINTATSGGRFIFHIMAALAEFERGLISERTIAGMQEARRKGRRLGRPPRLSDDQVINAHRELQREKLELIASRYEIHPRTLQRRIRMLDLTI